MTKTDVRKVAPSIVDRLQESDLVLTRELVQFAIEQLTATLHLAGRKPIAKALERYRDDAAALLERLQQ